MAERETNWTSATAAAEERPDGRLVNVHNMTLKSMEEAGVAYQRDRKWYVAGKGPGPLRGDADAPHVKAVTEDRDAASTEEFHFVDGVKYLCHKDDHYCPPGSRSPARVQFDDALKVLLLTEYQNGAMWAVERIREEAKGEPTGSETKMALAELAAELETRLSMRVAELAEEA
jgi:hypothetical protein